ncbi:MAG: hypothetical protein K9J74_02870 [Sulfuritalea sp.]|nr:hypothetical protein [Sulfuritalea sp.]
MIRLKSYLRLVQASAFYDLLVTLGFATPWTFTVIHSSLALFHSVIGAPGALPEFDATHVLMANLLGSIVTIWSILRLRTPQILYGRYDAAARFLFASWQIYAVAHGASAVILMFTFFELLFGIAQCLPIKYSDAQARNVTRELNLQTQAKTW